MSSTGSVGSRRLASIIVLVGVLILVGLLYAFQRSDPGVGPVPGSGASAARAASADTVRTPGQPAATRSTVAATPTRDPISGLAWIEEAALPAEARRTLQLIDRGGPYPYDRDGITFGNFEGILPKQNRGYYKEYTVPTPGQRDRGARRIVTGNNDREFFWTADHYASFARIRR